MTGKLFDPHLDRLEQRFQALRDQLGAMPEACRPELEGALQELSQAIAALRADRETGESLRLAPPGGREAQGSQGGESLTPMDPEAWPSPWEATLRHVFNAIPDMLNVIDRDFNIIMSNWHDSDMVPEEGWRGRPKCYQVYHHQERPCEPCHVREVFATGQPQKTEKINLLDGRTREFSAFPVQSESGQVILVAEHVRDITDRHLAAQALKESEGRFRTLIEDSPESLFLTDVQGTILAASRVAARRVGKNLEEVVGAALSDLFSPEVAARRREFVEQAVATGRPVRFEDARDNFYFDNHINPILDAEGKVSMLSTLAMDITDKKHAEQALKESEERFRMLFDHVPDAYILADMQGEIIDCNQATEELAGYGREELIGNNFACLPWLDFRQQVRLADLLAQAVRGEVMGPVDFTLSRKDGREVIAEGRSLPLNIQGQNLVLTIARDITARKRAEAALRESEELYRSLFQNMLNGFAYHKMLFEQNRPQDYIFLNVNRSFEALTGLKDVVGKKVSEVIPGIRESDPELLEIYGRVAWTGTPERFETYVAAMKMWFSIWVYSPQKEYFVTVFDDITERKQAEEKVRLSENRLQTLFSISQYNAGNVQDLFDYALSEAIQLTGSKVGYIYHYDEERQVFILNTWSQDVMQECAVVDPQTVYQLEKTGIWGEAVRQRQPIVVNDFQARNPMKKGCPGGHVKLFRYLTIPVFEGDRIEGVIGVANKDSDYDETDVLQLSLLMDGVWKIIARKQAEEALAAHLEFLQLLLDTIPNPIFFKDAQGAYLGCNKAFEAFLGVTRQEIVGKSVYDLSPQKLADEYHRMDLEAFQTTGPQVYESRVQAADGTRRHVVFHKATFPDPTGSVGGLVGIITDISDLKQAEAALRESEERFRAIFEYAPVGISMTDLTGRLLQTNRVLQALLGYTAEELRGREASEIIHPEERPENERLGMELLAGNLRHYSMSNRLLRKDGEIIWGQVTVSLLRDARGEPEYFVGTVIDITAQKQAEAELRQSEQRFRLMAETIQDVFWIAAPDLRRVIYLSPGFEQIWGRSPSDLYESPRLFIETVHPEERERVRSAMLAASAQGTTWSHEFRIIKPDGAGRWIQDRGFPVRDDQGRVILFTGVATDITEPKALEGQLLQAQKMEAVGRLAGGVAHDFNNLLMAITGYGELMRAKVLKDDPLYGYLENILKAGDRAAALTQQLLTFSRQKIVHPQVIDLNRVVLDLEPMLRRLIGEDLDLEVDTDRRLGAVKADPGQMGQIIMNLVVNARDAMPQGGRLTLKTAPVNFMVGCHSRFGLTPPGPYVMLVVEDTGVGMDEATQAHIFEPFFTTKEPGKGTGLGLSTVYGIVKQSGGYLDLASSPGAGSTFTIYLPRLEAIVEPPKAKVPLTASFRGEETVLLVEDEDVLRGLLAKFLRLYGYTVLEARHGGEALLTCERHPGPIHVMVTDVVMPQMSGRELADRLTPLRPEMKVLYMSGYTEEALVQHGVADLSVAFLQKPFRPIELARRVHAVLHHPVSQ